MSVKNMTELPVKRDLDPDKIMVVILKKKPSKIRFLSC